MTLTYGGVPIHLEEIKEFSNPCSEISLGEPKPMSVWFDEVDQLMKLVSGATIKFAVPAYMMESFRPRGAKLSVDPRTTFERLQDELRQVKRREQRGDRKAALERRKIEQQIRALGDADRQQQFEERLAEKRAEKERQLLIESDELWGQF